jgi:hypothetical protein
MLILLAKIGWIEFLSADLLKPIKRGQKTRLSPLWGAIFELTHCEHFSYFGPAPSFRLRNWKARHLEKKMTDEQEIDAAGETLRRALEDLVTPFLREINDLRKKNEDLTQRLSALEK